MKLGVHLGYWGMGLTREDQLAIVQEAERLGYDSVWTAEAYGSDAATILGWIAGQTTKIRIGSAIFQMPGRSPAMTAMTAATLDQLSDGRMILGIGSSGPQVAEGWHGQRFARQIQRTREYVAVVRQALARERLEFHGETLELPLPDGPGKALKLTIAPVQERIPIYLAAIGPNNTRLAGEVADGWIPTLFSPEHVAEFRPLLEEGAARAGRSLNGFDIAPTVQVFVTDDLVGARDAMRPFIALYVGGMGSRKQNFYNQLVQRYGFEDAAREVQDLYLDGKREEAMAALPDELIDLVSLAGPPEHVRERLAVYRDAGVGTLGITPMAWDKDGRLEQLRLVAELAGA
jgi:F420-dependent oxidoreductase-like protein